MKDPKVSMKINLKFKYENSFNLTASQYIIDNIQQFLNTKKDINDIFDNNFKTVTGNKYYQDNIIFMHIQDNIAIPTWVILLFIRSIIRNINNMKIASIKLAKEKQIEEEIEKLVVENRELVARNKLTIKMKDIHENNAKISENNAKMSAIYSASNT